MKDVTFSYEMARFVLERMDRGQRDFPTIVEELVQSVEGRTVGSRSYSAGSDLSETPGSSSLLAVPASVGVEGKASLDTTHGRERVRRIFHYFVRPPRNRNGIPRQPLVLVEHVAVAVSVLPLVTAKILPTPAPSSIAECGKGSIAHENAQAGHWREGPDDWKRESDPPPLHR